jgi:two-component system sensor histidine kinase EvgS
MLPERSFAIWREQVRGRSRPWSAQQREALAGLRPQIDKLFVGYAESMRLAREEAERATRAKSEFLARMSHEIRSPMSGLLGVLELLRGTALDDQQSRMAAMVHNSASVLLAVLNDILDFSKIEAGAMSILAEPFDLPELVADLVQPLSVAAKHENLLVTSTIEDRVPRFVLTDKLRLRQILGNLLSNAMKFTASGAITVRIDLLDADKPSRLRFRVRDSGIGMSEEVLSRLFAPFMQADGSTTRNFGGTGLGLCISRQLTLLLGGHLAVTSEPGVGSEFTLLLPTPPCSQEVAAQPAASAGPPRVSPCGKRVLVVDDDATIRWLSLRQLETLGFVADSAEDGEIGLRKFASGSYDLVLTDCHMPRMDGVALTRALRSGTDEAGRIVPIIGLTADVTEGQRMLCHEAGMTELAIKPLTVERLSNLLQRHLEAAEGELQPPLDAPDLRDIAFDDQIFLSIFDQGDPAGAAWITDWLDTARRDVEELAALLAVAAGEDPPRAAIRDVAHRLAGSASSAGAMLLSRAARALELGAGDPDMPVLPPLHQSLRRELGAAFVAISAFLNPVGPAVPACEIAG